MFLGLAMIVPSLLRDVSSWVVIALTLFLGLFLWIVVKRFRDNKGNVPQTSHEETETTHQVPSGRMRKRDIVHYYGKRMIRKAGMELGHFRRKPRERVFSIAKRFLQGPEIPERQLYKEPPEAFLEADNQEGDSNIPSDVLYLLKSVRAFGHFEKPLFMELCKHVQTKFIPSGAILFRPGLKDDSIYVVRNGCLRIYIVEPGGAELPLKEAGPGDCVHSMLSILDVVTGHPKPFKTVAAKALRDTYVLQVNGKAFLNFFEDNPDSLLRMVQIIMVRLQRVTFLALNQFLGLGRELFNQKPNLCGEFAVRKLKPHPYHHQSSDGNDVDGSVDDGVDDVSSISHIMSLTHDSDSDSSPSVSVPMDTESSKTSKLSTGRKNNLKSRIRSPKTIGNTDSDVLSDELSPPTTARKMVAIDTTQNKHFTHRLLPVQSPEFDNVIDQARVDRRKFSTEGVVTSEPSASPSNGSLSHFARMDSSEVLRAATQDLLKVFQLKDESLLKGRIQLIEVPADSLLGLEGDLESCVYFIASGRLKVFRRSTEVDSGNQDLLYLALPGEFCGVLSALTGEPSFITISAAVDSHLIAITKTNLYHIMSEQPRAICGFAYDLVHRLSPIVRQMDFAIDWMELEAGRALYRQGDSANTAYIILNGRVRSVVRKSNRKKELVDEYGRGETIGLVEVMTNCICATTVHAIRDTELACLPAGLFNTIKLKQPQVVSRLIQVLGERILGSYHRVSTPLSTGIQTGLHLTGSHDVKKHMVSNLSTVAVVPITRDVPLSQFTEQLCDAINAIAPSLRLTSQLIQKELGIAALENVHEYRLRTWLGHQEDNHRIVLYQADPDVSPWTAKCIRQADCILLIGLAEKTPSDSMTHIVKQVESISMRVQKELVLLHRHGVLHPKGTVKWLNALGWISSHFHVRCPDSFFSPKEVVSKGIIDRHSDCARLARQLTGTSVGLALGGGGARGIAHVGALKAMAEAGVPIDMIAGTSIGALVGALYCEDRDAEKVEKRARVWSKTMTSLGNIMDLTYPSTSMFTGRAFNGSIHKLLGEKQIEDLWIPYLCVTTDITESKMRVHSAGSLWRYVRASMSLSGYLPPLCDPVDGHLLLDGGYVNNLPADVILTHGAETVIAIDVGSQDNNDLTNYGDHISGWSLLWNKINPFAAKRIRVPNLTEIQSRLAYVSCIRQLEVVKSNDMCEYIRPPIDNVGTLQFGSFENIVPIGYQHCKIVMDGWHNNQKMHHLLSTENEDTKKHHQHMLEKFDKLSQKNSSSVRDLVTLAAQITHPCQEKEGEEEGDEEGDEEVDGSISRGYWSNPEDRIYISEDDVSQDSMKFPQVMFTLSDSELT